MAAEQHLYILMQVPAPVVTGVDDHPLAGVLPPPAAILRSHFRKSVKLFRK